MKKIIFALPLLFLFASFTPPQIKFISIDVIIGSRQPTPPEVNLMRAEEAAHPNIAQSMHDLENAMRHLSDAPENFGGHKVQAQADLKQAWISLRKALYYRIWQDTH